VEQKFANKTVLITGGSRGQGAVEARMFAQAGAQIVIGDVLETEGSELVRSIRKTGGVCEYRVGFVPKRIGGA
jgi:NAD(P)-dependent dehydrogenase (short-subunit alcohol dehydrogenase family)